MALVFKHIFAWYMLRMRRQVIKKKNTIQSSRHLKRKLLMTLIDHVSPSFFLSSKSKGSNFLLARDVFIDFFLMMNSWC